MRRHVAKRDDRKEKKNKKAAKKGKVIAKTARKAVAQKLRAQMDMFASVALNTIPHPDDNGDLIDDIAIFCPRCSFGMTVQQVQDGFTNDVLDYSTCCPDCKHRFETSFAFEGNDNRFVWLCPDQTRDQYDLWISERPDLDLDEIIERLIVDRPEIAFNAYRYSHAEQGSVKEKIADFLFDD